MATLNHAASDGTGQRGHYPPRHCWVDDTAPGILLEWRAVDGHWQAWVVFADDAGARMEWLPEERVKPRT